MGGGSGGGEWGRGSGGVGQWGGGAVGAGRVGEWASLVSPEDLLQCALKVLIRSWVPSAERCGRGAGLSARVKRVAAAGEDGRVHVREPWGGRGGVGWWG